MHPALQNPHDRFYKCFASHRNYNLHNGTTGRRAHAFVRFACEASRLGRALHPNPASGSRRPVLAALAADLSLSITLQRHNSNATQDRKLLMPRVRQRAPVGSECTCALAERQKGRLIDDLQSHICCSARAAKRLKKHRGRSEQWRSGR
jgi:hypothetical protein